MFDKVTSNTRLFIIFVTPVLILAVIVLALLQGIDNNKLAAQKKTYQKLLSAVQDDSKNNIEKLNDDYTAEHLKKILSQGDLYIFCGGFWSYSLEVNQKKVTGNQLAVAEKNGAISIVLTENKKATTLPASIISLGSITRNDKNDSISKHISVTGKKATAVKTTSSYTLEVKNLKKGDTFQLNLTDQLTAKLGLSSNNIKVTVT